MFSMKDMLKKFEVFVERTEVARIVVLANSASGARELAMEYERRGEVSSSRSILERCIGCHEML